MNIRLSAACAALFLVVVLAPTTQAEERMIAGDQRAEQLIATGAVDSVTSPGRIVDEIGTDARNFGAGALITGTARGTVLAAGQALRGGARMAIGILDIFTTPFRDDGAESTPGW
ncbi:MAG: hypothetical protein H6977_12675 [Gammaproteobacteria bacterium]|nr:hypothetical protein [Gammaproteobacteria bacterium]MCP5200862.1 hypothetical protein [Gammaproteobacteria bacterium]